MTSGNFSYVEVNSIIVDRENRQRKDLSGIEELAKSIAENGLINPIVITRDNVLVAGERRLTAHKHLGFDRIAAQYADDLDQTQLHLIELEENVRRQDLTWKDHVNAVTRYHELQKEINDSWSQENTADALNISRSAVGRHFLVKKGLDENIPEVVDAFSMSSAANYMQRKVEREKTAILRDIRQQSLPASPIIKEADLPSAESADPIPVSDRFAEIKNTDFKTWAKQVQETPFNFIHCDFPYGVNAGDQNGLIRAHSFGYYDDTPDIYFDLLDTFIKYQDNFIGPSAHMIFWFSMDFYEETRAKLKAAEWRIDARPLIWHKTDNTGIIPDAQRGPRWIYETAFFCTRGDRKIVKSVANVYGGGSTKKYHVSEKPVPLLQHFFRMVVDETTEMLDPTCGSGNAVKAAEALGANWSLGLELDPKFAADAKENLEL